MADPLYPVVYVHTGSDETIMDNWQRVFPDSFWERVRRVHYADFLESDELLIAHTIFAGGQLRKAKGASSRTMGAVLAGVLPSPGRLAFAQIVGEEQMGIETAFVGPAQRRARVVHAEDQRTALHELGVDSGIGLERGDHLRILLTTPLREHLDRRR